MPGKKGTGCPLDVDPLEWVRSKGRKAHGRMNPSSLAYNIEHIDHRMIN